MKGIAYAIAGILMLVVLYFGSYYAMIEPSRPLVVLEGDIVEASPSYRFGGEAAQTFYRPAFKIDRLLRPERWSPLLAPL